MPVTRRRILMDVSAGTASMVALAFVVLGSTVALARTLSVEQFGKISVLLLLFNLASVFDAVRPVTIYFANRYADDGKAVFASVLWLDLLIGVGLGAVTALIAITVPFDLFTRDELLCLSGAFVIFFAQSAYWGWADAHGLVARTSVTRAALMAGVYLSFVALALLGAGGFPYALVLLIASAIGLVLFWHMCHSRGLSGGIERPDRALVAKIGLEVRRYMQFNLATLVLATVDRLAVSTQAGARSLGLYSGHFELATKPMALVRAMQSALNPHITKAAVERSDVYPIWGRVTKIAFGLVSVGAWLATVARDWLVSLLLGAPYVESSDIFAAVVLAQCFVVLGYACALLLNSSGNFSLQKSYYTAAAVVMGIAVFPAAALAGATAVAAVYLAVRTVDVWLLLAAVNQAGRRIRFGRAVALALTWCVTGYAAWCYELLAMAISATAFGILLSRSSLSYHKDTQLSRTADQP